MYTYKAQENFIYRLHPLTLTALCGVIFILSLVFSHPLYLLGLFAATAALIINSGNLDNWKPYLRFCLIIILIIMLVNAVLSQAGSSILWTGPYLPGLGQLIISVEALAYGVGMSLRLLVIISICCFFTYAVNPDRVLALAGNLGHKSVLAITISTRLFPLMIEDFHRIKDIQRCRGVGYNSGNYWQRLKSLLPLSSVILLSSMERSLQMAESMYARAYASGSRTFYNKDLWRPGDYIVLSAAAAAFIIGMASALKRWSVYSYYPCLQDLLAGKITMALIITIILLIPIMLNRGWKKWPQFRSKI